MADVADGRLRSVSRPGAPFHRAGERAGPRLRPEPLHEGDAPALRCAEQAPRGPRVRRRPPVGRRLRHSRLGLAPPAPQGRTERLSQCRALVQPADGAPRHQARDGSKAGLSQSHWPVASANQTAMMTSARASRRRTKRRLFDAATIDCSEPASATMPAWMAVAIVTYTAPSASVCDITEPAPGRMNSGSTAT